MPNKPTIVYIIAIISVLIIVMLFLNNSLKNSESGPEDWALSDKESISTSTEEETELNKLSELIPVPDDFREIVLENGLRFGIPKDWVSSSTNNENSFTYQSKDFKQKQVFEASTEGEDNIYVTESGFKLVVETNFYIDFSKSRCKIVLNKDRCYELNILNNWNIYKLDETYNSDNYVYNVYLSDKKPNLHVVLYPPHNMDSKEAEDFLVMILETVEMTDVN